MSEFLSEGEINKLVSDPIASVTAKSLAASDELEDRANRSRRRCERLLARLRFEAELARIGFEEPH